MGRLGDARRPGEWPRLEKRRRLIVQTFTDVTPGSSPASSHEIPILNHGVRQVRMVLDIPPSPGSEASTLPVPEGRETHEVEGKQTSGGSWPSGALRDHALARPVTLSVESQEPTEDMVPEGAGVSEGDESAVAEGGQPAEPGEVEQLHKQDNSAGAPE